MLILELEDEQDMYGGASHNGIEHSILWVIRIRFVTTSVVNSAGVKENYISSGTIM